MVKLLFLSSSVASVLLGVIALDAQKTKSQLTEGNIIPTIFEEFEPTADLKITYDKENSIVNGQTIALQSLASAPGVFFSTKNPEAAYTFLVVDLDSKAPNATIQWLKANINANDTDGEDVSAYTSPKQGQASSPQRIIYALFEQPKNNLTSADFDNVLVSTDLKKFVSENKFKLINAAYVYAQNATEVIADRLIRIQETFHQAGLLDNVLGTVDGLLEDVEDILDIHVKKGNGKQNGNDQGLISGLLDDLLGSDSVDETVDVNVGKKKGGLIGINVGGDKGLIGINVGGDNGLGVNIGKGKDGKSRSRDDDDDDIVDINVGGGRNNKGLHVGLLNNEENSAMAQDNVQVRVSKGKLALQSISAKRVEEQSASAAAQSSSI